MNFINVYSDGGVVEILSNFDTQPEAVADILNYDGRNGCHYQYSLARVDNLWVKADLAPAAEQMKRDEEAYDRHLQSLRPAL